MKTRTLKLLLPGAGLMLMVGVAWANQSSVQVVSTTPDNSSQPTPTPNVTVNGRSVPLDESGNASVSSPAGTTKVQSKAGQTTVTTSGPGATTSTVTGDGSVNITVDQTNGSSSTTYSSTNSSGGSSFSSFNSFYSSTSDGTGGGIGN
jgi:hypothetical protein